MVRQKHGGVIIQAPFEITLPADMRVLLLSPTRKVEVLWVVGGIGAESFPAGGMQRGPAAEVVLSLSTRESSIVLRLLRTMLGDPPPPRETKRLRPARHADGR